MKRYAVLLLLVLGLSASAWGNQIGTCYTNSSLDVGQWASWNPRPNTFPTPETNPQPNPRPTSCPPPCWNPCPLPSPSLSGRLIAYAGLQYSGITHVPCLPNSMIPKR